MHDSLSKCLMAKSERKKVLKLITSRQQTSEEYNINCRVLTIG